MLSNTPALTYAEKRACDCVYSACRTGDGAERALANRSDELGELQVSKNCLLAGVSKHTKSLRVGCS